MEQFDWRLISSFLAVLDEGSLAGAASITGTSQPTLGRHVSQLEAELGVTLFERGRGGMVPTETALAVADGARTAREAMASISMAAAGSVERVEGTIRITASEVVATYILPSILRDLLAEFPNIEVELVASNTQQNLLQRDADIALRMVRPTQNNLIARQIGHLKLGIYATSDYLEKYGEPEDFEDLKHHVVIGYDRSELILDGMRAAGYEIDRHFFRFRCDNQITCFEALSAGTGIGFAPAYLAAQQPNLVRLLNDLDVGALPLWLVTHREVRTSQKVRKIYDFLGERLSAFT